MNDVIVQFAMLWGETIGYASTPKEIETAKEMKQYDSEELLYLLSGWAEEYMNGDYEDTVDFFNCKLGGLFSNFVRFTDVEKTVKYKCKYCGCAFCGESDDDMDEDLWGHIQMNHEKKFKEVQDWETPYMVEECYNKEN